MVSDCQAANDRSRERLSALLRAMDESDLARRLPNGKTVATTLVHLAFWDDYAAALLGQWSAGGINPSRSNFDAANEALDHLAGAVAPSGAIALAREAAERVDAAVAALGPQLTAAIAGAGFESIVDRSRHRELHLGQIEDALGPAGMGSVN
jgi:hypothetical protein